MNRQASLAKIFLIDHHALAGIKGVIVFLGFYFFLFTPIKTTFGDYFERFTHGLSIDWLLIFFGISTIAALIVTAWRIYLIKSVCANGVEVNAILSRIRAYRGMFRLEYEYMFMGERILCKNIVQNCKATQTLMQGSQVVLIADQSHPTRAFIRDLYL
jgi:hypothetical protein